MTDAEGAAHARAAGLVDDVDAWTVAINIEGCIRFETTDTPRYVIEVRRMANRRLDGRPTHFWTADLYREGDGGGHVFVEDGGRDPELARILDGVPDLLDHAGR